MSAPFLTFLNIPAQLYQEDGVGGRQFAPSLGYPHQSSRSSSSSSTTYVAIITRHGKTFTKVLNPSSINASPSHSSVLRGRKRALSGGGGSSSGLFFNPSSLQKKTKLLLFWSTGGSKRNSSITHHAEQLLNESSMVITARTTECSLYKLPTEILIRILHHLHTAANVLEVAQTSRRLYSVCHDHHIWYQLLSEHYFIPTTTPSDRCLQIYKDHVELDRRWARGDAHVFYLNEDEEHKDSVYAIAWIDAKTIVSVSRDRSIKVWDLGTRNCLFTRCDAHQGSILCLTIMSQPLNAATTKRPLFAVTGSSDTACTVWSLPEWNPVRQFSGHSHSVLSILAINDEIVATASRDATIQIWRITDGKVYHVLRGHTEAVNGVKRFDDQRIVSASGDGTLKIWCLKTGECLETLTSDIGGLSCMQVVDNTTIWAGGLSSYIQVWKYRTTDRIWETKVTLKSGHTNLLRTIDSLEGKVITAGYDKVIKVWDSQTGKCLLNFQSGHSSKIFSILLGRTHIVSAGHDKRIMVLDFAYLLANELVR
ncbi:WD40-repeat-containing domain protein [Phascolomyces articulosus]|uniref:WD40-repeat-containing domain protein n=1 Tax=Phascolomyces articulosus TaxID=60185 RepID=A0AAD5PCC8_9FUNG|nr:WD40-repeat-containing domain protein [Phascolomyces articulosus]